MIVALGGRDLPGIRPAVLHVHELFRRTTSPGPSTTTTQGNTLASQFFTRANAPEIARVKIKSAVIIAVYSTMILGLPLMVGFVRRTAARIGLRPTRGRLIAVAFVAGTLANVADVTQVAQLGRYYLPLFVLMLPSARSARGILRRGRAGGLERHRRADATARTIP